MNPDPSSGSTWLDFVYCGMHDIPLRVYFELGRDTYLLDRDFDEALDDYPEKYELFRLESRPSAVDPMALVSLIDEPKTHLGQVPVKSLTFDASRRKAMLLSGILPFIKA